MSAPRTEIGSVRKLALRNEPIEGTGHQRTLTLIGSAGHPLDAAGPAGMTSQAIDIVAVDVIAQQVAVFSRRTLRMRRKAGREFGLDADGDLFVPGPWRCNGKKMIHRLRRRASQSAGIHAESVGVRKIMFLAVAGANPSWDPGMKSSG